MNPDEVVETIHDVGGLLIEMPTGLLLLWIELTLLSKLLISPLPERPLVMGQLLEERPRPWPSAKIRGGGGEP